MEENSTNIVSSRSIGVKFGLISAIIYIITFLVIVLLGLNAFDNKWGWLRMVISIVILIFAHKSFKDQGDGYMSWGQGVGIGFMVSLISLLIGLAFTYTYVNFIDTSVMNAFYDDQHQQMEAKNMSEEQIEMAVTWTKKLFWPLFIVVGLFFGVIIAMIISIFTQKRNPEQVI